VTAVEQPPPWSRPATPTPEPAAPEPASVGPALAEVGPDDAGTTPPGGAPPGDATEGRPGLDLDAVTADLAAVEAALERLDQGSYGRCGACASAIDDDVLAADPTATTCAAHLPV
jgi:hypothetical protein